MLTWAVIDGYNQKKKTVYMPTRNRRANLSHETNDKQRERKMIGSVKGPLNCRVGTRVASDGHWLLVNGA